MAQEMVIRGSAGSVVKERNPVGVWALGLVTLGISNLVWWFRINRELMDLGRARQIPNLGDSPGKSLLAYTLGACLIVPPVMTVIGTSRRIMDAQRATGEVTGNNTDFDADDHLYKVRVGGITRLLHLSSFSHQV